jgi:hypothetical protein
LIVEGVEIDYGAQEYETQQVQQRGPGNVRENPPFLGRGRGKAFFFWSVVVPLTVRLFLVPME